MARCAPCSPCCVLHLTDEGGEMPAPGRRRKSRSISGKSLKSRRLCREKVEPGKMRTHMRTHRNAQCDGNASHKPLAISHKKQEKRAHGRRKNLHADRLDRGAWDADAVPADDPILIGRRRSGFPGLIALVWWAFEGPIHGRRAEQEKTRRLAGHVPQRRPRVG